MTNAESKQQYEGAILQQLIKNSERLVTIENKVDKIGSEVSKIEGKVSKIENEVNRIDDLENKVSYVYKSIKWIVGLLGAILIAVLANLLSQPILSLFN